MSAMAVFATAILRFYLVKLNKKLDRGEIITGVNSSETAVHNREERGLPGVSVEKGFRVLYNHDSCLHYLIMRCQSATI
jgi:hypothetical protein